MTDNGPGYRSLAHAAACRELGLRHLFTEPTGPATNGKACVLASRLPSGRAARLPATGGLTQAKGMSRVDGCPEPLLAQSACLARLTCVRFVGRRDAGGPAKLT